MNFKVFCTFFIKTCLLLSLFSLESYAKNKNNGAKAKSDKTRITSDFIDIKRKSQKIEFIDNVVVKNGPDMMTAKKMTVFYEENDENTPKKAENNSIDKIVAKGDVKVFSSEFVATSDTGYYNPNKSLFILEENVVVNNGDSIGTGNKFIYNLNTRTGDFVGKKKNADSKQDNRVIVIINKDAKKRSNKGKK